MLKLHSIRMGFATNSSSSHSIIRSKTQIEEILPTDDYYGWEEFLLSSPIEKMQYVLLLIQGNIMDRSYSNREYLEIQQNNSKQRTIQLINESYISEEQKSFALEVFNIMQLFDKSEAKTSSGSGLTIDVPKRAIDHESHIYFPYNFSKDGENINFITDILKLAFDDHVYIVGGNDNSDPTLTLPDDSKQYDMLFPMRFRSQYRAKYHSDYNFYTLIDDETGTKIRCSFDIDNKVLPEKGSTPDLVDLKITDYCNFGCAFCYQASTVRGNHAPFDKLKLYIDALKQLEVLEVAIGGGEPTSHPEFKSILSYIYSNHIIPNFTTKSVAWLEDKELLDLINHIVGGIAFSCSNKDELMKYKMVIETSSLDIDKVTFQHVIGSVDEDTTLEFVKKFLDVSGKEYFYKAPITFLGYKNTGRGKMYKSHKVDFSKIMDLIYNHESSSNMRMKDRFFSIDTALANDNMPALKDRDISPLSYETKEGKFSMYIDAVDDKLGRSSYHEDFYNINTFNGLERIVENYFKTL